MTESFSARVSLRDLRDALERFEIDAGVIDVDVILTVDDRSALTISPAYVEPVTIQGKPS